VECDDSNAAIHPGASETCNSIDDNCNGQVDEGATNATTWYQDADGDGYGGSSTTTSCTQPSGYVSTSTDCNDNSAAIHPGATETCNSVDDNCNGQTDEGSIGNTWYRDSDGDGFGNSSVTTLACNQPSGYVSNSTDCNDSSSSINPNATESCNGVDDNCNGQTDEGSIGNTWYRDADGDGFGNSSSTTLACNQPSGYVSNATDCNDNSSAINPNATETCNGVDDNCNGQTDEGSIGTTWYRDGDSDGYGGTTTTLSCSQPSGYVATSTDCNDANAAVHPNATEACNGIDDDCDGSIDEAGSTGSSTWYLDGDSDGYGGTSTTTACNQPSGYVSTSTDCNDACAAVHPNATEACNGIDDDCDGQIDENGASGGSTWYLDSDSDGYGGTTSVVACSQPSGYVSTSTDCNDSVSSVHPNATETCNGIDDNCNGLVDDNAVGLGTWYRDADGDGYGNSSITTQSCSQPSGYVASGTDCNDASASINPGATESCNGVDDNCNGQTDEGTIGSTWYRDADGDGYGTSSTSTQACSQPSGYVSNSTDCNDNSSSINPGASESCNSIDDNCNGQVDEGSIGTTWYRDADGDGYGSSSTSTRSCSQPSGYVSNASDCNDSSAAINPAATETCNSIDDNCNGQIDEGSIGSTWYRDADRDGYGSSSTTTLSCSQPSGYVANSTDCNDSSAAISPAASEVCDSIDNNCNGQVDEGNIGSTWYRDSDGDGYGTSSTSTRSCSQPSGYVANSTDCNDSSSSINPGATETCNSIDDNCNGQVDEGSIGTTWYRDADGDGYGSSSTSTRSCSQPSGYVSNSTDCNDSSAAISPAATEVCDGVDNNCNGQTDEGSIGTTWYRDADGDGYGTSSTSTVACTQPSGYVSTSTDCNDGVASIHPNATETCNSLDDDCDGLVDEGSIGTTWYRDADGDGYGTSSTSTVSCTQPSGYVSNSTDCNDSSSAINPGATDICDGIDNNCSGYADDAGLCPCTVLYYGTKPYMFCTSSQSWTTAASTCSYYGYSMLTVNDSAENVWAVDNAYRYYYGKWWTGGNDRAREGTWTWYSGQAWTYSNWHSGEPNDSGGNEDCMQFGRFLDYSWNDEPCTSSFRYICEGP